MIVTKKNTHFYSAVYALYIDILYFTICDMVVIVQLNFLFNKFIIYSFYVCLLRSLHSSSRSSKMQHPDYFLGARAGNSNQQDYTCMKLILWCRVVTAPAAVNDLFSTVIYKIQTASSAFGFALCMCIYTRAYAKVYRPQNDVYAAAALSWFNLLLLAPKAQCI